MAQAKRFILNIPVEYTDGEGNKQTSFRKCGAVFINTRENGEEIANVKMDFAVSELEYVGFEPKDRETGS